MNRNDKERAKEKPRAKTMDTKRIYIDLAG
jgi:hypothetical protein